MKCFLRCSFAAFLCLIYGCSSVYQIDPGDSSILQPHDKAFVLIQVETSGPGGSYTFLRSQWVPGKLIAIGDFNSGGSLIPCTPYFISESLTDEEWIGLHLPPGDYYLGLAGYDSKKKDFTNEVMVDPVWSIRIMPGDKLVFAGRIFMQYGAIPGYPNLMNYTPDGVDPGDPDKAVALMKSISPVAEEPVFRSIRGFHGGTKVFHMPLNPDVE